MQGQRLGCFLQSGMHKTVIERDTKTRGILEPMSKAGKVSSSNPRIAIAIMGAVTGKGLSDLIREEFGLRITFLMMLGILIVNFGNIITEFAGIASSLELFGLSKYHTVPVCAVVVWLIIVKGQYKSVEKIFLAASFFYIAYIIAGVLARPAWLDAMVATVKPPSLAAFRETPYLYMSSVALKFYATKICLIPSCVRTKFLSACVPAL